MSTVTDGESRRDPEHEGYDLGLLVVHGIGDQRQGATLVQWTDALANWLKEWNSEDRTAVLHQSADQPRKVAVTRASLRPTDNSPANVTMQVLFPEDDIKDQKWLIAEGWWAGAFEPPKFGELWGWSFSSVPAMLAVHANALIGSAFRRYATVSGFARVAGAIRIMLLVTILSILILLSPVILAVLTFVLIAGLVAQALPFPALRSAVKHAQLILIGTIGDSQRLIESPTQAGAIKAPIVEGLAWLRERGCRRVVVLAHSQGAAVTYKALVDLSDGLHEGDFEAIDSFISIGSGLPKVHAMEHVTRGAASKSLRIASFAMPTTAIITALSWWFLINRQQFIGLVGMGVIGAVTGIVLLRLYRRNLRAKADDSNKTGVRRSWSSEVRQVATRPLLIAGVASLAWAFAAPDGFAALIAATATMLGLISIAVIAVDVIPPIENDLSEATSRWIDLYATRDPVPAGATLTTVEGRPESWPVANLGSRAKDHTYYSQNEDECLTYVGIELLEVAGIAIHGAAIRSANSNYGFERKWRVGWRSFVSLLLLVASITFTINTWGHGDTALQGWYGRQVHPDSTLVSFLPDDLPSYVPLTMSTGIARAILALAYIAGSMLLIQTGQALWSVWNRKEARREIGPTAYTERDIPVQFSFMIAFLVFAVIVGAVPFWFLKTIGSIELTERSTGLLLIVAIALPLAIGVFLPRLLVGSGLKRYVIGRDKSRAEAMIGFGNYQMSRGETDNAIETFRRAMQASHYHHRDSPAAYGGLARALDRKSGELQASGHAKEGTIVGAEAAKHFAAAAAMKQSVSIKTLVDYANFLVASRSNAAEGKEILELASQIAVERKLQSNTGQFLAARIAHSFGAGDKSLCDAVGPPEAEQLVGHFWFTFGRDEQLATSFALLVAMGPSCDRSAEWRGHIDRLLADGYAAPNVDLRVPLSKLPGSLNEVEVKDLRRLAANILRRPTNFSRPAFRTRLPIPRISSPRRRATIDG